MVKKIFFFEYLIYSIYKEKVKFQELKNKMEEELKQFEEYALEKRFDQKLDVDDESAEEQRAYE